MESKSSNFSRLRCRSSTNEVIIKKMEQYEATKGKETPSNTIAMWILEYRLNKWSYKYDENPSNIDFLTEHIMLTEVKMEASKMVCLLP